MVVGLSLAVFAQEEGPKKPPPKGKPPVINPQPKPKPENPKKPSFALLVRKNEMTETG